MSDRLTGGPSPESVNLMPETYPSRLMEDIGLEWSVAMRQQRDAYLAAKTESRDVDARQAIDAYRLAQQAEYDRRYGVSDAEARDALLVAMVVGAAELMRQGGDLYGCAGELKAAILLAEAKGYWGLLDILEQMLGSVNDRIADDLSS